MCPNFFVEKQNEDSDGDSHSTQLTQPKTSSHHHEISPEEQRKQKSLELLKKKAEQEKQRQEQQHLQNMANKTRKLKVPELERIEEDEEEEEPERPKNLANMGSASNIRQFGNHSRASQGSGNTNPMRKSADGFATSDPMDFSAPPSTSKPSK